jgi:hypothetical protein
MDSCLVNQVGHRTLNPQVIAAENPSPFNPKPNVLPEIARIPILPEIARIPILPEIARIPISSLRGTVYQTVKPQKSKVNSVLLVNLLAANFSSSCELFHLMESRPIISRPPPKFTPGGHAYFP